MDISPSSVPEASPAGEPLPQAGPRFVCLHGHFYQPPRENPWLEEIERQESAYPYHDWNDRIAAECYAPNAAARLVDNAGNIQEIANNYRHISFNFGPTLLSWLEAKRPDVYEQILKADEEGMRLYGGHGPAIAQAYNHMILPLANGHDQRTQVFWGIRDFEHRFRRRPEGMWLPETAVNLDTLEVLVEHEILYTVLAPRQAARVRRIGEDGWHDVSDARIDPRRAYLCRLPSGRSIALFFYDGNVAQECAFGGLLRNGHEFASRLLGILDPNWTTGQMVHVATDGETYGHHVKLADMTLAYTLKHIGSLPDVNLTVYGEFLERFPPEYEVEIFENSSWSDVHGIERWRSGKGSCTGMHAGWQQEWRGPLRQGLDELRDRLARIFEDHGRSLFQDAWRARDAYVDLVLDRSSARVELFFDSQAAGRLRDAERIKALKLLEMQRNAMLMFTSCGWFFDEVSGIETVQILQYAACAIQIAEAITGEDLEPRLLEWLRQAPSNIPEFGNAAVVYERFCKPARVEMLRIAVHYAISSLFGYDGERTKIFCYDVENQAHQCLTMGRQTLALGRARLASVKTGEEIETSYAVLHLGDHNIMAGVHPYVNLEAFKAMKENLSKAFLSADLPATIRLIDRHFGDQIFSVWHLFKDEQERVLNQVLEPTLADMERAFRHIYSHHSALMNVFREAKVATPRVFATTVEFLINTGLRRALAQPQPDLEALEEAIREARRWSPQLDTDEIALASKVRAHALLKEIATSPHDLEFLRYVARFVSLLRELPLRLDLWEAQNVYFVIHRALGPDVKLRAAAGDLTARDWTDTFAELGQALHFPGE